jgi:hypothetical protein
MKHFLLVAKLFKHFPLMWDVVSMKYCREDLPPSQANYVGRILKEIRAQGVFFKLASAPPLTVSYMYITQPECPHLLYLSLSLSSLCIAGRGLPLLADGRY